MLRIFACRSRYGAGTEAYAVAPGTPTTPSKSPKRSKSRLVAGLPCSIGISDNKQRAADRYRVGETSWHLSAHRASWMAIMGDRLRRSTAKLGPKTTKRL